MASTGDTGDSARGGGRPRGQKQGSAPSRRGRAARRRATAPDAHRGRERVSSAGRGRSNASDRSEPRPRGQKQASAQSQSPGLLTALWRALRASLRRLERQLKRALASPEANRILTALLARRLPGPLRVLVEGLGDPDQRGFLFWWLVVTLIVTLVLAALLSVALAPVAGVVALVGVGVWMLVHEDRQPAAQRS